mmetsp:Transcript_119905/g.290930  ORF Transcript_119905/g.290930 Transcript_119905/m.290930 type:complete len:281 (+) Transcript_119905:187-1029(+)
MALTRWSLRSLAVMAVTKITGMGWKGFFGSLSSSFASIRFHLAPSMKSPCMFWPSSGVSRTRSGSTVSTSVCVTTSSRAHWSFLCCLVTSWRMPVRKPWALVKPVIQYERISFRPFSSHVFSCHRLSSSPVNQPPMFGSSHEISAPEASCVQRLGTRPSKTELRSSRRSAVMTSVPSIAMTKLVRFARTMAMMLWSLCNSWKRKMLSGAPKPRSSSRGGPLSLTICARKTSSTKSGGILPRSSFACSFTISSTDLPPLAPLSLGCVSMMVTSISEASFSL